MSANPELVKTAGSPHSNLKPLSVFNTVNPTQLLFFAESREDWFP